MTVTVSKPALNLREELSALKKPTGIKGEELLRANTISDVYASLNPTMFRNRIINGDMRINQSNVASVSTHVSYPVDRFRIIKDTAAGTMTMAKSTTAPNGFTNSCVFTVGTAYAPNSGENNFFVTMIEGSTIADFGWGTAGATPATLSFWTRSSSAGLYGGAIRNNGSNRSYVFSYRINIPNIWEYKTITIPGDITGTWETGTTMGAEISWGLSVGSNYSNTPGSWYAGNYINATGANYITNTAGATWYITGVQLEKGTVATPFEYRPVATELQLCQRYFEQIGPGNICKANNTTAWWMGYKYAVPKRAAPTFSLVSTTVRFFEFGVSNRDTSSASIGGSYAGTDLISGIIYLDGWTGLTGGWVAISGGAGSSINSGPIVNINAEM